MKVGDVVEYDELFKKYHKQYELPYDWRLLKAQLFAESNLNPKAQSPVGALGLAQFMPATWSERLSKCNLDRNTSRLDAEASIKMAASYMADLLNSWNSDRPAIDKYCLALASYNAGVGNLLKAQKLMSGAVSYKTIIKALPIITGQANGKQTSGYVIKILQYYVELVVL
jgi:membrane-bound lytic murein transglycosylase F